MYVQKQTVDDYSAVVAVFCRLFVWTITRHRYSP